MSSRRQGFTLVELLLAIGIAVTLVTLLYQVFKTVSNGALGLTEQAGRLGRLETAMESLMQDTACMFLPDDDGCAVRLTESDDSAFSTESFGFCRIQPPQDEQDLRWSRAYSIEYRLEEHKRAYRLLRIAAPLVEGSAVSTNEILTPVTSFKVRLFDGTEWHDVMPEEDAFKPHAAEISLGLDGVEKPLTTQVFIPTGAGLEVPTSGP